MNYIVSIITNTLAKLNQGLIFINKSIEFEVLAFNLEKKQLILQNLKLF